VTHNGYRFTIVNMDGRRIAKVKIEKIEQLPSTPVQKESRQ
jgi:CBS domain containing-hemolysin-like protein